jgi:hypothetical protein
LAVYDPTVGAFAPIKDVVLSAPVK